MASDADLTRRDVLKRGAGAVVAAGAAVTGGILLHDPEGDAGLPDHTNAATGLRDYFADVGFPPSRPRISVAVGENGGVERMVRAAVGGLDREAGMKRFVGPGDVVLIKPNAGFDRPPSLGATTHPEVVRWLIRLSREAGAAEVLVADHPIEAPQVCFARSGIGQVGQEEGATVVMPATDRFAMVALRKGEPDIREGEALGRWPLFYEPLARATKAISVAPVKDHNLCSASMNLKNWYGMLGGRRNRFHQAIHETISDLALMFSPTLVIADGTRVMMRNGPTGGRPSDVRPGGSLGRPVVVASVDPVACDAWCYERLLGRDPQDLRYLALAERKIGMRIAEGASRFGRSDWRTYERRGQLVKANV
jgi:uncharacterized protein (DUF362 family)